MEKRIEDRVSSIRGASWWVAVAEGRRCGPSKTAGGIAEDSLITLASADGGPAGTKAESLAIRCQSGAGEGSSEGKVADVTKALVFAKQGVPARDMRS